ncbi:5-carboxymethyl-2-hydroxymuconate isomerase [Vibrio ostreicida]|uniref:5-carboxymethyl-2-hydroxymuconate isomerase n=1 Tax=Vibrio ostreicida TaxID=526588 RepID=A0ABT8C2D6_9VIBR|nr:5-carboxymethyl-2-hydroxymuconate isomerase [Vibrio ostreicida]MDN3612771.1 5-carboxymethyl-2-hydroxymuconate isomerase [Vibrio ostreicida]
MCVVEHSSSLEGDVLNQKVFWGVKASNLFEPDGADIKVRSHSFQHYQTGINKLDFVHVTLRILSGRSTSQKAALSHAVLSELLSLELTEVSLTVEVIDIESISYRKRVV